MREELQKLPEDTLIIHGACSGADKIADTVAMTLRMPRKAYPARWDLHGKAAGPIRNQTMLDTEAPIDLVIAFDLGGRGTADMIRRAERSGVKVLRIGNSCPD